MDRAAALVYLNEQWPGLQTTLGVLATDAAGGWKAALDGALRSLGTPTADLETATVAVADEAAFIALLDYCGARRLFAEAATKVDVSVADVGLSKRYSQMRDGLQALIDGYQATLSIYGVGPVQQMQSARLNLDFLEPAGIEGGGSW